MTEKKAIGARAKAHTRYYLADGTHVPGVTTVLGIINKPQLVKWANSLGLEGIDSTKYVDETAAIGTLAHEMIQEELGGPAWDRRRYNAGQVDLAENALISYFEWRRRTGVDMETLFIEKPLVSEAMRCGGTIDWYGHIDGKPWLVDIKTCKRLYEEHVYQVAAYAEMLREVGLEVSGVRLLRVGRTEDEGFDDHVIDTPELAAGLEVFRAARALFEADKAYKKAERSRKHEA